MIWFSSKKCWRYSSKTHRNYNPVLFLVNGKISAKFESEDCLLLGNWDNLFLLLVSVVHFKHLSNSQFLNKTLFLTFTRPKSNKNQDVDMKCLLLQKCLLSSRTWNSYFKCCINNILINIEQNCLKMNRVGPLTMLIKCMREGFFFLNLALKAAMVTYTYTHKHSSYATCISPSQQVARWDNNKHSNTH